MIQALLIALSLAGSRHSMAPCLTDEAGPEFPNCVWTGDSRGDHAGDSFVVVDGRSYTVSHDLARWLAA